MTDLPTGPSGTTLVGADVRLPDGRTGQVWAYAPGDSETRHDSPTWTGRRVYPHPPPRPRRDDHVWVAINGAPAELVPVADLAPIHHQHNLFEEDHT